MVTLYYKKTNNFFMMHTFTNKTVQALTRNYLLYFNCHMEPIELICFYIVSWLIFLPQKPNDIGFCTCFVVVCGASVL